MKDRTTALIAGVIFLLCPRLVFAQDRTPAIGPVAQVYATIASVALKAYVFRPNQAPRETPLPAVVIFHGGGLYMGEPSWSFGRAEHFAGLGMVAIAAQYRLSNQSTITPLEGMADARAVIRWMRANAATLGINPNLIAAYGSSAGAHLAVSAAIFDDSTAHEKINAAPNALILVSPAVDLENDKWPQKLLGSRANVSTISPAAHVRKGLPPTLILQGDTDTVTPLAGAQLFYERMRAAGNRCELQVYSGVGHLFTPAGIRDDGWPQPDPKIQAEALKKAEEFLSSLGFIN
ncbi:alpha/beta hydrolase [candidate division KSB1 bacterium]|nr:alpha/beta hydrolase [candidate division KSB1 bacterium]